MTTRSNAVDICPLVTTTNCISYQIQNDCLGICEGDSLSYALYTITNNICSLNTITNVSSIAIPSCLTSLWSTNTPTIYNFINTLTQEACVLQTQIDNINTTLSTFNPQITLDYQCCSNNPCFSGSTVSLTQAFQNIISCICGLSSQISGYQNSLTQLTIELQTQAVTITNQAIQITTLNNTVTSLTQMVALLQSQVQCLNSNAGNVCP